MNASDPKAPPKMIIINKPMAAKNQLVTAIRLWFHYGDPISILALSAAAYDCYEALGAHVGKQSTFRAWLATQSKTFQGRARFVINFIKHGRKKMTKNVGYTPILAEAMIFDCIESHKHLYGEQSDLMTLFVARWAAENPSPGNALVRPIILKMAKAYDLADRDRTQFLNEGLKRLSAGD